MKPRDRSITRGAKPESPDPTAKKKALLTPTSAGHSRWVCIENNYNCLRQSDSAHARVNPYPATPSCTVRHLGMSLNLAWG